MFYFSQGIIFGLYAAVLPGPMQAFLLSQIMARGWKKTLLYAFIPLFSDGPVMLAIFLLLSQLPEWFLSGLRIAGGLFILYLAWDAYRTSLNKQNESHQLSSTNSRSGFLKGVTMNLLNPNVYIFWATIGVPIILEGWQISAFTGLSFVLGMYGTMIPMVMLWIVLFGTLRQLKDSYRLVITRLIAVLLLVVGITMIGNGIWTLLPGHTL